MARRPGCDRRDALVAQPHLQPLVQLRVAGQAFAHLETVHEVPARIEPARTLDDLDRIVGGRLVQAAPPGGVACRGRGDEAAQIEVKVGHLFVSSR
jgi:hypothetical protein